MSGQLRAPSKPTPSAVLPSKRKGSIGDAKVDSVMNISTACNDLEVAKFALFEVIDVLENENSSKTRKLKAANNLKDVQKFIDNAINLIKSKTTKLSPVPYFSYAFERLAKVPKTGPCPATPCAHNKLQTQTPSLHAQEAASELHSC